jgi:hypothetical protein
MQRVWRERKATMALTDEDREWVKLLVKDVARQVNIEVLRNHVDTCPVLQKIAVSKAMIVGLCVGAAGIGSSLAAIVEKLWK